MSEPEVNAHVPVRDVIEATIVSDRDALHALPSGGPEDALLNR